ncbi:MAG: aldehyde dehydrogenase family protein [Vicinamibacterales bacterium]
MWNQLDYRPLEGFVYAITPFNFTAIGGNLSGAPALMGCGVVWKPAATSLLANYYTYKLLEAAGLPPGVINFVPGDPVEISNVLLDHPDLGGVHFTGSTAVFNSMWHRVGQNLGTYRSYPRLVGETGGKDFIVMHPSADPQEVAVAAVRGAYEFQGQKCSAASRLYVPKSMWADVRDRMVGMMQDIRMGDVRDFRNFMRAVIDRSPSRRSAATSTMRRQTPASSRAAAATVTRVSSSSPPSWKRPTPATVSSARRSSAPSSRCTRTTMRSSARRCRSWTAPRRMRSRDRSSRATVPPCARLRASCATRPATSTSTTSPPAPSSASSPSAAAAPAAPTTRLARR